MKPNKTCGNCSNNFFKKNLARWTDTINTHLTNILKKLSCPTELKKSVDYSLMAGGKRIRPILCLAWAEMLGLEKNKILNFACGLEFIHTYSLIHDDLPSMDNDDLRRGKPTNHKVFGEAMAILAGDALLTQSFELMANNPIKPNYILEAILQVSIAAGPQGMVGGQVLDLSLENQRQTSLSQIQEMHRLKTGALLEVACVSGAILAQEVGASKTDIKNASIYGRNIGLAFQIVDDILDVIGDENVLGKPVGSDIRQGKSTYPSLVGLEESYNLAQKIIQNALESLQNYKGNTKIFLEDLANYIIERAH
ncbi:geranylgeranyl diphosphate synthase, type II [Desulfonauticus submarinus]|uniref:Geranylgeranyl diphosphate synthase, type II n=1 Tax=Desulfonauticus submarinus TaxID=206665 RepID=A0A1H0CE24_9BACT|nr:farnesyl diphosphate synthase [Desulfonauticus submarinus]SDN56168.1 geranylgeranyl diphosphate synthase, type II [Desulfonauticus submarinus]